MKVHTIAEPIVLPAAKILVRSMIGEEAVEKLASVSLFNNTVKRRIQEKSADTAKHVTTRVKDSKFGFSIRLDESTDVANSSQLLVYVRFIQNNIVKTKLRMSRELAAITKGINVFNVLANFFKENELDWKMLVGCTTDGAPAMLGQKSRFQAYVKDVLPKTTFVHCFIHRFVLCAKVLPSDLMSCLNKIIKIVNFIKTSALNTWLFARLCENVGPDQESSFSH